MTTLDANQIRAAADDLYVAEASRRQIAPPATRTFPQMDMDDAYAVQSRPGSRKIAEGDRVIGYKIGLTSRATQRAMKIDTPDFGVLLQSMGFDNRATIDARRFTDPRIEVELAFVLKRRLSGDALTVDEVLDATDYIVPAARAHRCAQLSGGPGERLHAQCHGHDLRQRRQCCDPSLATIAFVRTISICAGAQESSTRTASWRKPASPPPCWIIPPTDLLGGKALRPHGVALEPGQIILSGSFTAPVPVKSGDIVRADYGRLGVIECRFT